MSKRIFLFKFLNFLIILSFIINSDTLFASTDPFELCQKCPDCKKNNCPPSLPPKPCPPIVSPTPCPKCTDKGAVLDAAPNHKSPFTDCKGGQLSEQHINYDFNRDGVFDNKDLKAAIEFINERNANPNVPFDKRYDIDKKGYFGPSELLKVIDALKAINCL